MKKFRTAKKLHALDARLEALEAERRAFEVRTLGGALSDPERRQRYFAIEDLDRRQKMIGVERALQDVRREQQAAAVVYWTTVTTEIREKLADLKDESPASTWRRGIWLDVLTILWIIAGAGWLAYEIPGAVVGTVVTAGAAPFLVRSRTRRRPESIRKGEEQLRSTERQLQQAQREAARALPPGTVFSQAEAQTGQPDHPDSASTQAQPGSVSAR